MRSRPTPEPIVTALRDAFTKKRTVKFEINGMRWSPEGTILAYSPEKESVTMRQVTIINREEQPARQYEFYTRDIIAISFLWR